MQSPTYASVETFKRTNNISGNDKDEIILRLLFAATGQVEEELHRHFYPLTQTRSYEWPSPTQNTALRLYLNADLLAVKSLTSGGAPMTHYVLQPVNEGPPYSRIESDLSSGDSFEQAAIRQLSLLVEGRWGYCEDKAAAGLLVGGIDDAALTLVVSDASKVGVGDLIFIDDEAMLVIGRTWTVNSSQTTAGLTDKNNDVVLAVDSGADFNIGEVILVDAEKMLITGIATDNLIVKRVYDGSVLAAHTDDTDIYNDRVLSIVRGGVGTTAASHSDQASIARNLPPGLITDWCLAEALTRFFNEESGYARNLTSAGGGVIELSGKALADVRQQAVDSYCRARMPRAI
jgi:hypothetical protein